MKAILVREHGGPEVLKLEDLPDPKATADQVVVRLKAVGVNPVDVYIRTGERTFFNYILRPLLDSLSRSFREH